MKSKWSLAVGLGLVALALWAANVLATPGVGFTAAQQWKGAFGPLDLRAEAGGSDTRPWKNLPGPTWKPKWFWTALAEYQQRRADSRELQLTTKGASDVYVTRNAIAVGGNSGWHTHPGPSLIIVTVGEITAYDGDDPTCAPKRYRAGEGFVDPGGTLSRAAAREVGLDEVAGHPTTLGRGECRENVRTSEL